MMETSIENSFATENMWIWIWKLWDRFQVFFNLSVIKRISLHQLIRILSVSTVNTSVYYYFIIEKWVWRKIVSSQIFGIRQEKSRLSGISGKACWIIRHPAKKQNASFRYKICDDFAQFLVGLFLFYVVGRRSQTAASLGAL